MAGRLILAAGIHVPFFIASGVIVAGIAILATAHRLLGEAERVQAQQVTTTVAQKSAAPAEGQPARRLDSSASSRDDRPCAWHRRDRGPIDNSPVAGLVTDAAARLAAVHDRVVHVVHAQEGATAGDAGIDAEDLDDARAAVRQHLERLAARHVPPRARSCCTPPTTARPGGSWPSTPTASGRWHVLGAPTHGGLPALMDASASQELWRHARSNVLIINPEAPVPPAAETRREPAHAG